MTDNQMNSVPPTTPPPPAAAAPPPSGRSRWSKVGSVVVGIALVIVAGVKVIDFFTLPGCDSSRITDTVRDIFKSKSVELTKFEQIQAVKDESSSKMCGAYIETADEKANIQYSISWQGWTPFVRIEKVDDVTS